MSLPTNGWNANPSIQIGTGLQGVTKIDFADVQDAVSYNLMICATRFTSDPSIEGILAHYPACGTHQTWNTPYSYFEVLNAISFPGVGDKFLCVIAAFDNAQGYSYSAPFEIQMPGTPMFDTTLGSMEYCSTGNSVTTPPTNIPVTSPIKKKGKK